jgi:hypothetical protein
MMEDLFLPEYHALLRSDLSFFAQRCFAELNPQADFAMNWHIDVIAAKLTAVWQGKVSRLIINLPPRHLKSLWPQLLFQLGVRSKMPQRIFSVSATLRSSPTSSRGSAAAS